MVQSLVGKIYVPG